MSKCVVCKSENIKKVVRNKLPMFECQVCNLMWRQEFDVGISHYEDEEIKLGKEKLNARMRNVKSRIEFIEKYLEPNNLCDIGTGEGMFLLALKKKGYKNIVGIEPKKEAVSFARSQGLNVFEGTLVDAPRIIRDNGVHTTTLFHVIEHLENPRGALKEIYDTLSVGDNLIIETPNVRAHSILKVNYKHPLIYPEHLFYFDTKNLTQLLESIGFHIVSKGRRSFDQNNMSIQKSLSLLGVGKNLSKSTESNNKKINVYKNSVAKTSIIRTLLRKVLNRAVLILGRVDYQWVIVQK